VIQADLVRIEDANDVAADFDEFVWVFLNLCQSTEVLEFVSSLAVHDRLPPQTGIISVPGILHAGARICQASPLSPLSPLSPQMTRFEGVKTALLLICSNIFTTIAWYGHLKYRQTPLVIAIVVSWRIAFAGIQFSSLNESARLW
jgi:hypothetical protein